jgi:DNA-binding SARP family transcriptional activator
MIFCRTLGPIELTLDGGGPPPPELLWRKNIALLVYLACSPKRARSREHLVGLLWGDKPESAARHSLNEALRVVRRYGGEACIESEGDRLRLAEDAVQLDLERFETAVENGDWQGAAQWVAGDFMEGFSVPDASDFEDWLSAERFAWRTRSIDALVHLSDRRLDEGRVRESSETALRALALEATADVAARAAMRSLAISGDRAGAISLFESFVDRLDDELGIEPDEETKALATRVRQERAWRTPVRPSPAVGAETRRPPLIAREAELASVLRHWSDCRRTRRAAAALIAGDPGAGKSRLAEEIVTRARLDGASVVAVRAVEADHTRPGSAARALFPDSQSTADRPATAFIARVREAVTDAPLLIWIDDAQWADGDTLLATGAAIRDLAREPLFLLLTHSPFPTRDEIDQIGTRLGRDVPGTAITLPLLDTNALRALAAWALPDYDDTQLDRVTRRIATDSAGIPLLAVELLHAVALGLDLNRQAGAWPEPFRTLEQTVPGELPDSVVAAIRVGFRRLSAQAQTVCAAAAVLGDRVSPETLRSGTGIPVADLEHALDELEWERWLTAEPRGYSFVARIVRDVVARDMITAGQRQRLLDASATG